MDCEGGRFGSWKKISFYFQNLKPQKIGDRNLELSAKDGEVIKMQAQLLAHQVSRDGLSGEERIRREGRVVAAQGPCTGLRCSVPGREGEQLGFA